MPASKFTKKADTPRRSRLWQRVYDGAKADGKSGGEAIRQANTAAKKDWTGVHGRKKKRNKH